MGGCAHSHAKATLSKPISRVRKGSVVTDTAKSVVLDRELEQDKKPGESEPPRIRCPLCGWSPRKQDKWVCTCGHSWNTFDTGGVCPAACTSGLRPNVSLAAVGRRIRSGMRSDSACSPNEGMSAKTPAIRRVNSGFKMLPRHSSEFGITARSEGGIPCLRSKQTTSPCTMSSKE